MPGAQLDPVANDVRYLILAVQAEGERRLNDAFRARGLDLTATQSEVLEVLHEVGPMSQRDLGERLVCTKGNVSRLIDRMVERGMLRRDPDPADRRRVRIDLTPYGTELADGAYQVLAELLAAIRSLFDEDELRSLAGLLDRIALAFEVRVDRRSAPLEGAATP